MKYNGNEQISLSRLIPQTERNLPLVMLNSISACAVGCPVNGACDAAPLSGAPRLDSMRGAAERRDQMTALWTALAILIWMGLGAAIALGCVAAAMARRKDGGEDE